MKLRYRKKRVCLLETAAYIMNEREDVDVSGELGMAFFSVWNLLTPMKWHFSLGNAAMCDIRAESEEIFTRTRTSGGAAFSLCRGYPHKRSRKQARKRIIPLHNRPFPL